MDGPIIDLNKPARMNDDVATVALLRLSVFDQASRGGRARN
jgi:hypothetical protein